MAQITDTSDATEAVVRSDIQVPADADGSHVERNVVVVNSFLEGERQATIRFVLDERFRQRVDESLQELIERGIGVMFKSNALLRDNSNAIRLNLGIADGAFEGPAASILMRHDVNREEQVPRIINTEFRELI